MSARAILIFTLLVGCNKTDVNGDWELVDATWTALEYEENGTTRSLSVRLELEQTRDDVAGDATMSKTTTVGDDAPTVLSESAEVEGERESGGAVYIDADALFAFECDVDGDRMVCTDDDLDQWEFERTEK